MGPVPIIEAEALTQPNVRRPFINAVLTRRGVTAELQAPWDEPRVRLVVFGPESLDREAHAAVGAEVVEASNPVEVLDQLEAMGCKSVLVEGGGDLIFQLIAAGRIDTIFMTLAPRIGGCGAPSLADGAGFGLVKSLTPARPRARRRRTLLRYDKQSKIVQDSISAVDAEHGQNRSDSYCAEGGTRASSGRPRPALKACRRCWSTHWNSDGPLDVRLLQQQAGEYSEAIRHLRFAVAHDPKDMDADALGMSFWRLVDTRKRRLRQVGCPADNANARYNPRFDWTCATSGG